MAGRKNEFTEETEIAERCRRCLVQRKCSQVDGRAGGRERQRPERIGEAALRGCLPNEDGMLGGDPALMPPVTGDGPRTAPAQPQLW